MGEWDAAGLKITSRRDGDRVTLDVEGEDDSELPARLREALMTAVMDADVRSVRVDLTRVVFMDTSGLAALVQACRALYAGGRRLGVVLSSGSQPERLLQKTGLVKVMDVTYGPHGTDDAQGAA